MTGKKRMDLGDFLHATATRGPLEKPLRGSLFSHFQQHDMDIFLAMLLIQSHPSSRNLLCIPSVALCVETSSSARGAIRAVNANTCPRSAQLLIAGIVMRGVNTPRPKLLLPKHTRRALLRCRPAQFIVFNCGLYLTDTLEYGHANCVIFNARTTTIERYEPHGFTDKTRLHDAVFERAFGRAFPNWKYASVVTTYRLPGPQRRADAFDGMCSTYAALFMFVRLAHPSADPIDVYVTFESMSTHVLLNHVLKFNKFLIEKLKAHDADALQRHVILRRYAIDTSEPWHHNVDLMHRARDEVSVSSWRSGRPIARLLVEGLSFFASDTPSSDVSRTTPGTWGAFVDALRFFS